MNIEIKYKDKEVTTAIQRLLAAGADLSPLMRELAGHLQDSVEESFERERDPVTGASWPERKAFTLKSKPYRDKQPKKILQFDGHLLRSVLADWSKTEAIAGTNVIYAATHQFGDEGRGIPARAYLGLWPEHKRAIESAVVQFVERQWR